MANETKIMDGNIRKNSRDEWKAWRKKHPELSDYQISKETGVDRKTIKRIEGGVFKTTDETLDMLATIMIKYK